MPRKTAQSKQVRLSCRLTKELHGFMKKRQAQLGFNTQKTYLYHLASLDGYKFSAKDL